MVTGTRKTIRVHKQAVQMFEAVKEHLAKHPQDGILFLLNYEQALRDLGFELSRNMRDHFAGQFPTTDTVKTAHYHRIRAGERFPIDIRLALPARAGPYAANDTPLVPPPPPAPPSVAGPGILATVPAVAQSLAASEDSAGFSILLQLSNDLINRALSAAYDSNLFPHHWQDDKAWNWSELNIDLDVSYSLNVAKPVLDFNTNVPEGISIAFSLRGTVTVSAEIWQLLNPTQSEYQQTIPIQISASLAALTTVFIAADPAQPGQSAVFLNLANITGLTATIGNASLPANLVQFLQALLVRIARTELATQGKVPISFGFASDQRSGITITAISSHIRPPSGGALGSLSIGVDTFSPPRGQVSQIANIMPAGAHYGMVLTKSFVIDQVWGSLGATQFPKDAGSGVTIRDPDLEMREGEFWFQVHAVKDMGACLPDVHATATLELGFQAYMEAGTWKTRLNPLHDPDISIDFWDQLFYTFVAGLLGGLIGLGPIAMIVFNIVVAVLENNESVTLGGQVRAINVGFSDKIPGTNITVAASTPVQPEIHADRIYGYGDAVFS